MLRRFWRGKGTARQLWIQVKWLPLSSAFWRAMPNKPWDDTQHLLATVVDVTAAAAGSKYRVTRPGDEDRERELRMRRAAAWEKRRLERARQVAELNAGKEAHA